MTRNTLYNLLERYINKTITDTELHELKLILEDVDDVELSQHLQLEWDRFEVAEEPRKEILEDIKHNIDRTFAQPKKYLRFNWFARIASILLIVISVTYFILSNREDKLSYYSDPTIVETTKGQQVKITMPDGTAINLNSESTLTYSSAFTSDNRVVHLSGEGFFDVCKDKAGNNFIVETEYLDIEVLGTSFDVKTNSAFNYKEKGKDVVEVALLTGSIKATTKGASAQRIIITPNQKMILNKQTGEIGIKSFDGDRVIAWTKNELIFRSSPLKVIFMELEEKYGMPILINDSTFNKDLFTGTFKSSSIKEIMDVLSTHYRFAYTISDNTIIIKTPKGNK